MVTGEGAFPTNKKINGFEVFLSSMKLVVFLKFLIGATLTLILHS